MSRSPRPAEATQHLRRFCQVARIDCPTELTVLERYLLAWEERKPVGALVDELAAIKRALGTFEGRGAALLDRIAELDRTEREAAHLREEIALRDRRIAEQSTVNSAKDEKVDILRKERAELQASSARPRTKRSGARARAYRDALLSATTYTRTRADYERSIIRLSTEQKAVLKQIRLDADFLVKGAAGTGKTLILLEAIRKARGQGELGLDEISGAIALLTFTNTLTNYDKYLAELLDLDAGDRIQTASSWVSSASASSFPTPG